MEALLPGYKKRQTDRERSGTEDPQTLKSMFLKKGVSVAVSTTDEHGRSKSTWQGRNPSQTTDEHGRGKSTWMGQNPSQTGRAPTLAVL